MIVLHEKGKPFYQKNYGKSNMFSLPFAALCFKKLYYALMKLQHKVDKANHFA